MAPSTGPQTGIENQIPEHVRLAVPNVVKAPLKQSCSRLPSVQVCNPCCYQDPQARDTASALSLRIKDNRSAAEGVPAVRQATQSRV